MATKTNLITAINTQLTAIITQAKVRLASLEIVNELYPTVISETQATTNVLTAENSSDRTYTLKIAKQGRLVTIKGRLKNELSEIVGSIDWFTITNAEFLPSEATTYYGFSEFGVVQFILQSDGTFTITGSIGADDAIDINFTYFTLN